MRAYVQPAFSSSSDLAGGGARFTRLRAVMSAEGNAVVGRIIAEIFDDTTNAFIEAIEREPAASAADDDRLAIAVPARRTLLHPGQPGAGDAAVARRSRWRRYGRSASSNWSQRRSPRCRRPTSITSTACRRREVASAASKALPAAEENRLVNRGAVQRDQVTAEGIMRSRPFPDPILIRERRNSSCRRWRATRTPISSAPATNIPTRRDGPIRRPMRRWKISAALHTKLGIGRAVIVNASVHGTDNRVALDAIAVSNGTFRAVANIDDTHHRARPARAARRRLSRLPLQFRAPSRRRA